jgi:hypothetical protein
MRYESCAYNGHHIQDKSAYLVREHILVSEHILERGTTLGSKALPQGNKPTDWLTICKVLFSLLTTLTPLGCTGCRV